MASQAELAGNGPGDLEISPSDLTVISRTPEGQGA
jgi:hypothetical protein